MQDRILAPCEIEAFILKGHRVERTVDNVDLAGKPGRIGERAIALVLHGREIEAGNMRAMLAGQDPRGAAISCAEVQQALALERAELARHVVDRPAARRADV